MTKKNDVNSKLASREQARKQSVVKSFVDSEVAPQQDSGDMIDDIVKKPQRTTRSKRVSLLLDPNVHSEAAEKCKKLDLSLNECINQLLAMWVKK